MDIVLFNKFTVELGELVSILLVFNVGMLIAFLLNADNQDKVGKEVRSLKNENFELKRDVNELLHKLSSSNN
jgi:hypothetical protein